MRKVIASLFMSLDGDVESPDKWQFDHFDEGMMTAMQSTLDTLDAALMGRVTYEQWASYWPTSTDEPFASFINSMPKYVVSSTLERVDWNNSTLLKGSLTEEINRLKAQPGKNIGVQGSITLIQSLIEHDLLDELTLCIHPVLAGTVRSLFKNGSDIKRLTLLDSPKTETGVMLLTYKMSK